MTPSAVGALPRGPGLTVAASRSSSTTSAPPGVGSTSHARAPQTTGARRWSPSPTVRPARSTVRRPEASSHHARTAVPDRPSTRHAAASQPTRSARAPSAWGSPTAVHGPRAEPAVHAAAVTKIPPSSAVTEPTATTSVDVAATASAWRSRVGVLASTVPVERCRTHLVPWASHVAISSAAASLCQAPTSTGSPCRVTAPTRPPAHQPPKVSKVCGCSGKAAVVPRQTVHRVLLWAPPGAPPIATTASPSTETDAQRASRAYPLTGVSGTDLAAPSAGRRVRAGRTAAVASYVPTSSPPADGVSVTTLAPGATGSATGVHDGSAPPLLQPAATPTASAAISAGAASLGRRARARTGVTAVPAGPPPPRGAARWSPRRCRSSRPAGRPGR